MSFGQKKSVEICDDVKLTIGSFEFDIIAYFQTSNRR